MCCASTAVMVAVVQCASSVGGAPRVPTLRMPPFFGAAASGTEAARQSASTVSVRIAHAVFRWLMEHLRVSEDLIEKPLGALFARAPEQRLGRETGSSLQDGRLRTPRCQREHSSLRTTAPARRGFRPTYSR